VTEGQEPKPSNAYQLLAPGQLTVKRRLGTPRVRQCLRVCRTSPLIQIAPFNENIDTLQRAVAERVFLVKENGVYGQPPKPVPGFFQQQLKQVRTQLLPFLPSTTPLSFHDAVETFQGCKKKRYERAFQNIVSTHTDVAEEAKVKVFVKYEKTDRTSKDDPVPRVISPRTPEYNLRIARYLRKVEEPIFDALGKLFGHKTVMKGVTMEQTGRLLREKWDHFKRPVAIGLDASRFDQHVSREALEFEHTIYEACFPLQSDKRKLMSLLRHQLVNHCAGYTNDGSLRYTVDGTRMSGDMNTSLGNCILMCMMIKAYADHCGIKVQLANNGDDCVVFMEKHDLNKFQVDLNGWFRNMGFNMVVEDPSYDFENIEFCQTRPIFDGKLWVMCRNPWTALAKDSVLLKNPKNVSTSFFATWLHAVGMGGMSLAGGMPVFQSFYRMYMRSGFQYRKNWRGKATCMDGNELLPWFMRETGMKGNRIESVITSEARCSFYYAFGVTPDEQVALEKYYDSMFISLHTAEEWHPRSVFPFKV